ncbi:RICIN domain-containing protein [Streptomyces sp. NPDC020965]|uniref:RICIN domain-containing protein n=1 Tax=Streptomyces sp. NPDC020965 TaxID=3365105 RepID=UPI0037A34F9A
MLSVRSRAVRGGLALAALAVLGLGTTPSASASAPAVTAQPSGPRAAKGVVGVYNIRAVHSGKCLAPEGNSTGEGAAIWQQPCDGRPSQRVSLWLFGNVEGIDYHAFITGSGKCWDGNVFTGPAPAPMLEYVIRTTSCNSYWKSIAFSLKDGHHPWGGKVIETHGEAEGLSTVCLHVHNASTGDDAGLLTQFCNNPGAGARNDSFEFIPV